MFVGVLRLWLRIPEAHSLKQKRKVVRSFKDRVRSKLRASVAEVGGLDDHQRAIVAVAVVSNDARRVDELLTAAASMAGALREAQLVDQAKELLSFGTEGREVAAGDSNDPWLTGQVFLDREDT